MIISKLVATGLILSVSCVAMSTAALAQTQPGMGGPEGSAAAQTAPAPAQTPDTPPNPQVVAFVDQQFPNADADKDGKVTAAEFTTWISGLKTAEQQKAGQVDPAAVKAYADGALAKADADKDGILTKTELVKFFGG